MEKLATQKLVETALPGMGNSPSFLLASQNCCMPPLSGNRTEGRSFFRIATPSDVRLTATAYVRFSPQAANAVGVI